MLGLLLQHVDWCCFWPILSDLTTLAFSESMELNDANLQTLTEFLRKTLDPDPAVRRPGNPTRSQHIHLSQWWRNSCSIDLHLPEPLISICFLLPNLFFLAEKFLESVEGNQNYPLLLLTLLEKSQDNVIRVCAAVTFKNFIKRNWRIVSQAIKLVHTVTAHSF